MRFTFFIFGHFCLEEVVVVVVFSPHTSHHLQPCDVSPCGPFKNVYREAHDNFMVPNQVICHGKTDRNSLSQSVPEVRNSGERVNVFGSADLEPLDPQKNLVPSTATDHAIKSEIREKMQVTKSPRTRGTLESQNAGPSQAQKLVPLRENKRIRTQREVKPLRKQSNN
jgi:hypothetical protein